MGYLKPLPARIARGQRFGANPGWGPNPPGGHNGDDYLSQVGEPIYAAGDGVVIHAGTFDSTYADNFGWNLNFGGNMVVLNLDGDAAPYVEYGHMDQIYVSAGQRVRRGQVIGTTGATDGGTGVITGPHLHVGCLPPNFNLNTNTYGRVNPDLYLTDYPDDAGNISAQSTTITPLEEDMPSAQEIAAAVWGYKNEELDGRDMRQIVADLPTADRTALAVWGYTNPNLDSRDMRQIVADFPASAREAVEDAARGIVEAVKAAPADNAGQAAEDAYKAFMDKLAAIKVTVTAGGNQ